MAYIKDDKIHCKNCGNVEFTPCEKVMIDASLENNKAMQECIPEHGINDRFILKKVKTYVCTKCGNELTF